MKKWRHHIIKMKVERRIHNGWKEFEDLPEKTKKKISFAKGLFGKYQYIYSLPARSISLIYIQNYMGKMNWEIYCLEGNLFEYTETFRTKKEAVKRVKELLE